MTGKAFAAGLRSVIQAAVVVVLPAILGDSLTGNPLKLIGCVFIVVLGSAFFSCLSMAIAGLALRRDRLMGIGQAITRPLFFSSSALCPVKLMPGWLQALTKINPLSYGVDALRACEGSPNLIGSDECVFLGAGGQERVSRTSDQHSARSCAGKERVTGGAAVHLTVVP